MLMILLAVTSPQFIVTRFTDGQPFYEWIGSGRTVRYAGRFRGSNAEKNLVYVEKDPYGSKLKPELVKAPYGGFPSPDSKQVWVPTKPSSNGSARYLGELRSTSGKMLARLSAKDVAEALGLKSIGDSAYSASWRPDGRAIAITIDEPKFRDQKKSWSYQLIIEWKPGTGEIKAIRRGQYVVWLGTNSLLVAEERSVRPEDKSTTCWYNTHLVSQVGSKWATKSSRIYSAPVGYSRKENAIYGAFGSPMGLSVSRLDGKLNPKGPVLFHANSDIGGEPLTDYIFVAE